MNTITYPDAAEDKIIPSRYSAWETVCTATTEDAFTLTAAKRMTLKATVAPASHVVSLFTCQPTRGPPFIHMFRHLHLTFHIQRFHRTAWTHAILFYAFMFFSRSSEQLSAVRFPQDSILPRTRNESAETSCTPTDPDRQCPLGPWVHFYSWPTAVSWTSRQTPRIIDCRVRFGHRYYEPTVALGASLTFGMIRTRFSETHFTCVDPVKPV